MKADFEKLMEIGESLDHNRMIDLVAALPSHVQQGWALGGELAEKIRGQAGQLVVVGMGGSAIAGDLLTSYLGSELERPLHVYRGYDIPKAFARDAFVLFSSYSGNTAETLSVYEALRGSGVRGAAVTSGGKLRELCDHDGLPFATLPAGLPPRASLGYSFTIMLRIAAAVGVARFDESEYLDAVASLTNLAPALKIDGPNNLALSLAHSLHGHLPVVYACGGLLGAVARRWGAQLNENAKSLAHVGLFPEVAHNEICGWDGQSGVERKSFIVSLEDSDDNASARRQVDVTLKSIKAMAAGMVPVRSEGKSRLARLLNTVMLGDFMSVYLAYLNGVDPTPVERIENLKARLASEPE
jgi:glucose/mannose-6-phosphate isomerase